MSSHRKARSARLPRRRLVAFLLLVLLVLAAWLGFRGWQARNGLLEARSELVTATGAVTSGDLQALAVAQGAASEDVAQARAAVDDPLWRLAAAVPFAGRSFAVVRESTIVAEQLVDDVLPPLLDGATALEQGDLLSGGAVDLALLAELGEAVRAAEPPALAASRRAEAMPSGLLPAPVADARESLVTQVDELVDGLAAGRAALEIAPGMLGADGPRSYFLAVHNNAEVRGTGGLVGAYAVLEVDEGRLSLARVGTNVDFKTAKAPVVDLGPEFSERYDHEAARRFWSAAVLTPDWPSAAAIMAGLWEEQSGDEIDGAIGVDPVAMSEILAVTGPAQVAGREIGAANVVDFIMRDEYAEFGNEDNPERKEILSELAGGLYEKVAAGGYSAPTMLSALGTAAGSGHLQIWSERPEEQAVIAQYRVSGSLPAEPGAYLQVVSNNAAGNKADYYIRRKVSYVRTGPGTALASVELTNTVDASAVPPIVIGRLDEPTFPVEPGQTRQLISIYAGVGQKVRRMFVDGVEVPADLGTEAGHGVGTVVVEIRPSSPTVVTAEVSDPGGELTYRQQPLVVDDELDLSVPYEVG